VRGRLRLTAAPLPPGPDVAEDRTAGALVCQVWDRAAVPLDLRPWGQHPWDGVVALPRLCRYELDDLQWGVARYLAGSKRAGAGTGARMTARVPTPLGWMIFMERGELDGERSPRSPLEQ